MPLTVGAPAHVSGIENSEWLAATQRRRKRPSCPWDGGEREGLRENEFPYWDPLVIINLETSSLGSRSLCKYNLKYLPLFIPGTQIIETYSRRLILFFRDGGGQVRK